MMVYFDFSICVMKCVFYDVMIVIIVFFFFLQLYKNYYGVDGRGYEGKWCVEFKSFRWYDLDWLEFDLIYIRYIIRVKVVLFCYEDWKKSQNMSFSKF